MPLSPLQTRIRARIPPLQTPPVIAADCAAAIKPPALIPSTARPSIAPLFVLFAV